MNKYYEENRIVRVCGEINNELMVDVINQLLYFNQESHAPIKMEICSPGGEVYAGLAIIDVMNSIESDVYTIGVGTCASMASLILAAGKKGHRQANEHCFILLHQAQSTLSGSYHDIQDRYQRMTYINDTVLQMYAKLTLMSEEQLRSDLKKDYIITTNQAIDCGLIDQSI